MRREIRNSSIIIISKKIPIRSSICALSGMRLVTVVGSAVLHKIVSALIAIRADEAEEITGLDLAEHGERGYTTPIFTGTTNFLGNADSYSLKIFPTIKSSQD